MLTLNFYTYYRLVTVPKPELVTDHNKCLRVKPTIITY